MASSPIKLPPAAAQFTPLSIARMLWLHRVAILVVWLVVSGIAGAIVYMLPAQYMSEVQIVVDPQKIPERVVQSMVSTNVQDRLATIEAQILIAPELQKIIDDFGLYKKERKNSIQEEIIQLMRKNIGVRLDRGWTNNQPGAFRVAYTGEDPAIVTQVTNRIANLFIEENMRTRTNQVEGTSEFVDTLLQDAKKRLEESDAAISAYKVKHNGELPEQVAAIAGNLARIQTEQNGNRDAIARAEQSKLTYQNTLELADSTLQTLLDRYNNPPAPVVVAPATSDDSPVPVLSPVAPVPNRVTKQSDVLESQLTALRARGLGESHPNVKQLKLAIAAAKEQEAKVAQEAANAPPQAPAPAPAPQQAKRAAATPAPAPAPVPAAERPEVVQAREHVRAIQTQIELIDKEIATRTADQDRLAQAVNDAQERLTNVPVREQEIAAIMRDHTSFQNDYQGLLGKASAARISSDMELRQKSEQFRIYDPAHVPDKPISPDRVLLSLIGSVGGLVLGFFTAFGQEFRKGQLLGGWELPEEAVVLARVPRISTSFSEPRRGFWSRWSWPRRLAAVSCVLLPIVGLLAAAKVYLVR